MHFVSAGAGSTHAHADTAAGDSDESPQQQQQQHGVVILAPKHTGGAAAGQQKPGSGFLQNALKRRAEAAAGG
jgi:hypothetical protein